MKRRRSLGFSLEMPSRRQCGGRDVLCDRVYSGHVIYGLVDAEYPDVVRYVGVSSNPFGRYVGHVTGRGGCPKVCTWAAALAAGGRMPVMVLLERCGPHRRRSEEIERGWIAELKRDGQADLNAW